MVPIEQLHLGFGILECPVQPVQLNLAELHMRPISLQETFHNLTASMCRKSKMMNTSILFLLHQIRKNMVFLIKVCVYVHLTDIVEQVEVEITDPTFLKLTFKNFLHLIHIRQIIPRELGSKIIILSRVLVQYPSHDNLRIPSVVSPCRVIIIDALFHGICDHLCGLLFINLCVIPIGDRKTHSPHAQSR